MGGQLCKKTAFNELFSQKTGQGRVLSWPHAQVTSDAGDFVLPRVLNGLDDETGAFFTEDSYPAPGAAIEGYVRRRVIQVDRLLHSWK